MLLEPSPDVYQISERAQRYVVICFFESSPYRKQVSTPSL
jgi:hypothetical protein